MKTLENLATSYHVPDFDQAINFSADQPDSLIIELQSEIAELKHTLVQERSKAGYWENLHKRNVDRRERTQEEHDAELRKLRKKHKNETQKLSEEVEQLKAKLRKRERQLFGKKSEKRSKGTRKGSNNPRGQQKGKKGHGRQKDFSHLSSKDEVIDVGEGEKICCNCQCPYEEMNTTKDSQIIEIEVKAHVRKIHRKCYRRTCQCKNSPIIKTAPPAPRLIPRSQYGVSVWIHFLVEKYWLGMPLNRTLKDFKSIDLDISPGTIVGGFQYLEKFLRPVYNLVVQKNVTEKQWNADETRWEVFEEIEGKGNYRWYLWVFKALKSTVFILEPSRGTKVIRKHLGDESSGIIGCDRYVSYICYATTSKGRILLAFCWVHVRRDFIDLAKKYPKHEDWAMGWVRRIGQLYAFNKSRLAKKKNPVEFKQADEILRKEIKDFKQCADKERKSETLTEPCQHVLDSLENHWNGLTTFVEHPNVNMDNNSAEREIRGPVVGRKNYYGSGSVKMASFTAMMFTIIHTLVANSINPRSWLRWFFNECVLKQEGVFSELEKFLPWNLAESQKNALKLYERSPESQDTS